MAGTKLYYSVLEKRIGSFIHNYGVDELISYLEDYDKDYKAADYRIFQELKQIACTVFDIPTAELGNSYIAPVHADTRTCISYCAYVNTRLNHDAICRLLGVSKRSVQKYIDRAEYQLKNPTNFKYFLAAYTDIQKQFIQIKLIFDGKANENTAGEKAGNGSGRNSSGEEESSGEDGAVSHV